MTEAEFQKRITDYLDWRKILWYHVNDSRKDKKGFPDLVIVGKHVIFAELKSEKGKVSPDQEKWLSALLAAGQQAYIWKPSNWTDVQALLAAL